MARKRAKQSSTKDRELRWILHEWDCLDMDDAKSKAKADPELHRRLREAGVRFEERQ